MKKYYNKTAVLDALGLFFLSGTIIYLLISKRIRELTSPSTDIFMVFAAIFMIIWAIYILRHVNVWKRKVNYSFFSVLSITSILLIVPHHMISAGGIVSENANYNVTSNQNLTFGSGEISSGNINMDDSKNINNGSNNVANLSDNSNSSSDKSLNSSFSIREVSDKEAKKILDKNAKSNLEQSKKVKESLGLLEENGNDNLNNDAPDFGNTHNTDSDNSDIDATDKIETTMPSGKKIMLGGYDSKEKSITVKSEQFYPWLNEIFINPEKYEGYKITISGIFWRESGMETDQFLLSRYLITCCVADASNAGILSTGDIENFNEGDWIKMEGVITLSNSTFSQTNKTMPYLRIISAENIEPESSPYVYYSEY